jgi:Ca-activated chloride channel family protein
LTLAGVGLESGRRRGPEDTPRSVALARFQFVLSGDNSQCGRKIVSAGAFSWGVVDMAAVRPTRNPERGAIAILMGFSLVMVMGFAALGFDLAYVRLARLEMKNATDAAAHAAILRLRATGNTQTAEDDAIAIAARNTVLGKPMILTDNDFTFGSWDSGTKTFSATSPYTAVKIKGIRDVSGTGGYVDLTFGRALGYTSAAMTEDTIGAFANRNFMIEMDITPSYICTIDAAVQADLSLLDQLHTQNVGGDRISLDVFTGQATQVNDFLNIRTNYMTIYQKWAGGGTYSSFLGGGKSSGITVCNKNDDPGPAPKGGTITCGGTDYNYPNYGFIMPCSSTTLTGYTSTVFAGTDIGAAITAGTAKLKVETEKWEPRILIVVTDGAPMMCTGPQGGDLCSNGGTPCCSDGWCNQAKADAKDPAITPGGPQPGRSAVCHAAHDNLTGGPTAADAAAAENIDLFVVKMTGTSTDKESLYAQSLTRNRGTFQWITDGTQLSSAFTSILGQVPISLVK